jgi:hypothetical protein
VSASQQHLSFDILLQDWLGESAPVTRDAIDAHLMACDACGELFDEVVALGEGVRGALQGGTVALVAGPGFLQCLAARGARIREYRLPPNGGIHCTVAPEDEVLVSRLQVSLGDVQRLDMALELSIEPGVVHRVEDIPFDARAGEVLFLPGIARVRRLPAHILSLTLFAREEDSSRELAHYTFRHTPWGE